MSVPLVVSGSRYGREYVLHPAESRAGTWRSCAECPIDPAPPKCPSLQPHAGALVGQIDLKGMEDNPCTV